MNKNRCIVTTARNHNAIKGDDIFYIEDYIGFGNIKKARLLTDEIFLNNKGFIKKYDYDGYKISWSWYDKIYHFSLKCLEIEGLIRVLKKKDYDIIELEDISPEYQDVITKYFFNKKIFCKNNKFKLQKITKKFFINSVLLLFSLTSIIYFTIRRRKYTAIWTGDFVYKNTRSDFRLNNLYNKLEENNVDYVEFIRTKGLKDFLINTYKRKKFSIYYFSFIYFISLFTYRAKLKPCSFYEAVLFPYEYHNQILTKTINILIKILRLTNVKNMVTLTFSSRQAHLAIAGKSLGIKNIGIMHGVSTKEHQVNEFMESYCEDKYLGPDVFGVWSDNLVIYYKKYSKVIESKGIVNSGSLNVYPTYEPGFKLIDKGKVKVLIISEPVVRVEEILPYIESLMDSNKFELAIKVRPMVKDVFYEELIGIYPEIRLLQKYDGRILEDGKSFDIFIGSYSTAILEASLINKISIAVKTERWGDCFGMDTLIKNKKLLCRDPNLIAEDIMYRIENEKNLQTINKIKSNFFDTNNDGAEWIVKQIKSTV